MNLWTDHNGKQWKVPNAGQKLKFSIPCHRALRAFVFIRDAFTCQQCGARVPNPPANYDGRETMNTDRILRSKFAKKLKAYTFYVMLAVDHVLSRHNGGSNHPDNLQTLCESCNSAKAGLVDMKQRAA